MVSSMEVLDESYEDNVHVSLSSFTIKQPIAIQESTWYTVTITVGYNSESITYTTYEYAHSKFRELVEMPKSFLLLQYSDLLVDNG